MMKFTVKTMDKNGVIKDKEYNLIEPKCMKSAENLEELRKGIAYEVIEAQLSNTKSDIDALTTAMAELTTDEERQEWDELHGQELKNLEALKEAQEKHQGTFENKGQNAKMAKMYAYHLENKVELTLTIENIKECDKILYYLEHTDTSKADNTQEAEIIAKVSAFKKGLKDAVKDYIPSGHKLNITTADVNHLAMKLYQGAKHDNKSGRVKTVTLKSNTDKGRQAIQREFVAQVIKAMESKAPKKSQEQSKDQAKTEEPKNQENGNK